MRIHRGLALAFRTISRNRLRTLFMLLGVAVGVASLTALSSVGESTRQETVRRFTRMAGTIDTITIRPGGGQTRGMPSVTDAPATLTFDDARAIGGLRGIRRVVEMQNAFDVDVKYRNRSVVPTIFGSTPAWMDLRELDMAAGATISDEDVRALARVVVIGPDVKRELFPGEEAIGRTVRIGGVPFQVKGVTGSRGAGPGGIDLDNFVLIPISTASRRLFNRDSLTMLIAQLDDPGQADQSLAAIDTLLRDRHHLVAPALDDFSLTNPRAALARMSALGAALSKTLMGVAVLALVIGGLVIMSLMLIAVSERQKEIGIRRSAGANRRDILTQFLLEALVISAGAGLIGIAFGLGASTLVIRLQKLPLAVVWSAVAVAAGISVLVGLVFGVHPAWKASRVDPIVALRS